MLVPVVLVQAVLVRGTLGLRPSPMAPPTAPPMATPATTLFIHRSMPRLRREERQEGRVTMERVGVQNEVTRAAGKEVQRRRVDVGGA